MNEFVEECRREWRRLRVPDPVADEMAAELAADLKEAEVEGVSPEKVLGSDAFDPRSFATDWAAERGVIRRPLPSGHRLPRRSRILAAIGAFALIATSGAVMVILASPSGPKRVTLAAGGSPPSLTYIGPLHGAYVGPPQRIYVGPPLRIIEQPVRVVLHPPPRPPGAQIAPGDINDSGVDTRTVGLVLLTAGVAGILLLTLFWLWIGRARRPRPAY